MTPLATRIYAHVLQAMQLAEELGSPEGADYLQLLSAIETDARTRAAAYLALTTMSHETAHSNSNTHRPTPDRDDPLTLHHEVPMSLGWTPGVAAFYRGKDTHSAALQLKLQAATAMREGYVQLDMTSGPKAFDYDWSRKIIWQFQPVELAAIIRVCENRTDLPPLTFKHDPKAKQEGAGARTKLLRVKRGPRGGAFWDLSETHATAPDQNREHSFAMNEEELLIVGELFRAALAITTGWTAILCTARPAPFKAQTAAPAA